jgi:hypothetical protein
MLMSMTLRMIPDHFVSTGGPLWLIAVRFLYHEVSFSNDGCGESMSFWNGS